MRCQTPIMTRIASTVTAAIVPQTAPLRIGGRSGVRGSARRSCPPPDGLAAASAPPSSCAPLPLCLSVSVWIIGRPLCRSAVLLARKLFIFVTGEFLFPEQTVNDWDKKQRCNSSDEQPANHGAPKRRVLFAALAQSERHRQHSDNHCQRGHYHGTQARETGGEGGVKSVLIFVRASLVIGKSHNQNAIGRGHADDHARSPAG